MIYYPAVSLLTGSAMGVIGGILNHAFIEMKLIVGLGNPGSEYIKTRHNLGKRVVLGLAKELGCSFKRKITLKSSIAEVKTNAGVVILALPLTYMNLSGRAVKLIKYKKKIKFDDLIVVCDDINLDFGTIRIKPCGSSGGHNGLRSIIDELGANQFSRLRVGIRNKSKVADLSEYVLSGFTRYETMQLRDITAMSVECLKIWLSCGINPAMNKFNQK